MDPSHEDEDPCSTPPPSLPRVAATVPNAPKKKRFAAITPNAPPKKKRVLSFQSKKLLDYLEEEYYQSFLQQNRMAEEAAKIQRQMRTLMSLR